MHSRAWILQPHEPFCKFRTYLSIPGVISPVPPEITQKLLVVNSTSSLITRLLNISVLVWMNKYLLDRLAPEEFSLYPVILSVIAFTPLLSGFLTSGIARFVVEADARGDAQRVTQIVSTMFPLLLIAGMAIAVLGILFAAHVENVLTINSRYVLDARLMVGLLMLEVALRVVTLPFTIGIYVRQRFVLSNLIILGTELLRMTVLVVLLVAISPRVIWLPVASVTATTLNLATLTLISRRILPALKFQLQSISWQVAKSVTGFGAWFYLGQLSSLIYEHSGRIILNKFGTAVDVNAYHIGSLADQQIRGTASAAASPLQPALTTLYSQGQQNRLASAYLRGNRYGLWATLFAAVPLFVFREQVIQLYIDRVYMDAASVIALLMMTHPFIYANHMLPKLAVATGVLRPFQLRAITTHAANVAMSIFFVWKWNMGALGPATATFLACAVGQPLLFWSLGWRMASVDSSRWLRETFVPGMLPALCTGAVLFVLKALHVPDSWLTICTYSAIGCGVYLLVLLGFCLQPYEKRDLQNLLSNIKTAILSIKSPSTGASCCR